jgi:UDP-N-acetylmuramyl pentapeptide phosphotransferase/UDP-N-acetylglucosamine-1-phosphate transferase
MPLQTFISFVALITAAVLSRVITRAIHPLLQRYALARPNARSSHRIPTPQGAGIAVIAATLLVATVSAGTVDLNPPLILFGATVFIALVGAVDDIRPIPVLPRLLLQGAAVAAIVYSAPDDLRIAPALPLAVEHAVVLVAGIWFVNLVNFMDGLDLMTTAEVVPVTASMVLLAWLGEFPPLPALIAAALCGAMLGFAPANKPVAKVFLGDVGSLPIGLLLGWLLLALAARGHLAAAVVLPLYYLADATITLLRRLLRGEPVWQAHRSHFYQLATDRGFSVTEVVAYVFILNTVLSMLAILTVKRPTFGVAVFFAGAILVACLLFIFARGKKING